jgi:SAM-dependent methyltransferase
MRFFPSSRRRRAEQALKRQLRYQRQRARDQAGSLGQVVAAMREHSRQVRAKLDAIRPIIESTRVLEVGSGSEGLIFFFGVENAVGVDPLADHYAAMFPWHARVTTVAAGGEALPFEEASFDVALCDNVVDHAVDPAQIVAEIARVLSPGGLLYFTVNIHSLFWHLAASAHAAWRALGIPLEIAPFADHTVHLTLRGARKLFRGLPFRVVREENDIAAARALAWRLSPRHAGDLPKRFFFKNAVFELIAVREQDPSCSGADMSR